MINIYIWVFVALIATNVFTLLAILFVIYLIAGILDLTYHKRHKQETNDCPDYVEKEN